MTNAENFDAATLRNLTPHEVVLMRENGSQLYAWPSAGEARATVTRERVASVVVYDDKSYDEAGFVPVSRSTFRRCRRTSRVYPATGRLHRFTRHSRSRVGGWPSD